MLGKLDQVALDVVDAIRAVVQAQGYAQLGDHAHARARLSTARSTIQQARESLVMRIEVDHDEGVIRHLTASLHALVEGRSPDASVELGKAASAIAAELAKPEPAKEAA